MDKDHILAFISGDLLTSVFAWFTIDVYGDSLHFIIKATVVLLWGVLGGLGGLVGKDLYNGGKDKVKKWRGKRS